MQTRVFLFLSSLLLSLIAWADPDAGISLPRLQSMSAYERLGISIEDIRSRQNPQQIQRLLDDKFGRAIQFHSEAQRLSGPHASAHLSAMRAYAEAHTALTNHHVKAQQTSPLMNSLTHRLSATELSTLTRSAGSTTLNVSVPSSSRNQPPRQITVHVENRFVESMRSLSPHIAQQAAFGALFALSIDSFTYLNCVTGLASPVCLEQFSENAIMNNPVQFALHMALFSAGYSGANWLMNRNGRTSPHQINPINGPPSLQQTSQRLLGIGAGAILASSIMGIGKSEYLSGCLSEIRNNPRPENTLTPVDPMNRFSGPNCSKAYQEFAMFMTLRTTPQIAALALTIVGSHVGSHISHTARNITQITLQGIQYSPAGRGFQIVYKVGGTAASIVLFMSVFQYIESVLQTKMTELNRVYFGLDHPGLNRIQHELISSMKSLKEKNEWSVKDDSIVRLIRNYFDGKGLWVREKTLKNTGIQDGFIKKTERMVKLNTLTREFYRYILLFKHVEAFGRAGGSMEGVPDFLNYQKNESDRKLVETFLRRWEVNGTIIPLRGMNSQSFAGMYPRAINNFQINSPLEFLAFRAACGPAIDENQNLVQRNLGWFGVDGNPYDFAPPRMTQNRPSFCASSNTSSVFHESNNLMNTIFQTLHPALKLDVSKYPSNADLRRAVISQFNSFWTENIESKLNLALSDVITEWNTHIGKNIFDMLSSQSYYYCVPAHQSQSFFSTRNSSQCAQQNEFNENSHRGLAENPLRSSFDDIYMFSYWIDSSVAGFKNYLNSRDFTVLKEKPELLSNLFKALDEKTSNFNGNFSKHIIEVQAMVSMLDPRGAASREQKQEQLQKIVREVLTLTTHQSLVVQELYNTLAHILGKKPEESGLNQEQLVELIRTFETMHSLNVALNENLRSLSIQYASIIPGGMEFR